MAKRDQPFSFRVPAESLDAYREAAQAAGLRLSEWARLVLDVSAGVRQIRHVYYIDVGKLDPKEALAHVESVSKKVRSGKW